MEIKSENPIKYNVANTDNKDNNAVIQKALNILGERITKESYDPSSFNQDINDYLQIKYLSKEYENFGLFILDNNNKIIDEKVMFTGTINGCSVFPREVVKYVMKKGGKKVIFFHNHPSGNNNPSEADKNITNKLITALSYINVDVIDHLIIGLNIYSFAENEGF